MVQELNAHDSGDRSYSSGYARTVGDRLPPQNIEAEESILGGILLDPEAIGRVVDRLHKEAFSLDAHKTIYRAALTLHGQGKPTDLMTVTTWLDDQGLLNKIGGQAKLADLVDRTVSAVNIDQYAALVMDKYTRRQLIHAGHEIAELGYETTKELATILDNAEQKIFSLTQDRPQQGLIPISDTLISTFNELELRNQDLVLPGLACNFYDLDAMTGGFQRSDLIIVAGRPSMGKCLAEAAEIVLADGSIATIGEIYHRRQAELLTLSKDWQFRFTQPSAFVDDGFKPVFRVRTRLGRCVESTITHPYLTIDGWRQLRELKPGDKIAVPRRMEVFGSETLSDCQVKLLAYLIGDGCLTHIYPQFTNSNPVLQADFTQAVASFAGLKVRVQTSQETRTPSPCVTGDSDFINNQRQVFAECLQTSIKLQSLTAKKVAQAVGITPTAVSGWTGGSSVPHPETFSKLCAFLQVEHKELAPDGIAAISRSSKNPLTLWLEELGLWGKNAHTKVIPKIVFRLQRSIVALFLNRLFATDGWASVLSSGQAQLGYCTVSEKLAQQVQHLLLRFGIIAAIKKREIKYKGTLRTAWQLDITDAQSIKNFITEIGIFGKEEAVSQVQAALIGKRYQTNRDLIPVSIWQQLATAKGKESWSTLAQRAGIKGYSNIHVGKRSLSRERLLTLATALNNISLQQLATGDIYWDEIVSIEPLGYKQVYDLTIPETHNFVANDICVHNTSFALNIAQNIAEKHNLPVAVFSLEMSKEQLVQRLLASEAGIESNRLRSGRISQNEWEPLNEAIAKLSAMPIFIDDTPNMTVTQMRSQARRLQADHRGEIGLILIDYLQLMEGSSDNRVQELSKITRSLKGLARELNVPVIALSQLSRGVEARTNKRPMMSDLRESGCLSGDSLVTLADSSVQVPIRELVGKSGFAVWALNEATMKIERAIVSNAFSTGRKTVFKLKTRLGRTIRATGNHKFLTIHGWKRLDELNLGTRLALPRCLPSSSIQSMTDSELALLGHLIGDGCTLPRHIIQYTTREEDLAHIVASLAVEVFGNQINPRISQERDWYQVYLSASYPLTHNVRNPIAKWLDNMGIFGLRSYEKFIPKPVFEQPQKAIAIFLKHLWNTDGSIKLVTGNRPTAYYASSSSKLALDVQSLLLRLGINARLSIIPQIGKGRDQYHVTVTGKPDIEKFITLVGAAGNYKQQAVREIAEYIKNIAANTNRDVIPFDVWRVYAVPAMQKAGITGRQMQYQLGNSYCGTTIYKQNISRERAEKLSLVIQSNEISTLASSDIYWDEIISIEADGETEVYDLTVPNHHNFIANNIVVHNSIEQDADLIIMLYRDAYYNSDSPDRDITEIIITKHRNGPTGVVKLLFDAEVTQFKNLARQNNY